MTLLYVQIQDLLRNIVVISFSVVTMAMTQNGVTALNLASQEGHVTIVRLLLEKEAEVNLCDEVRIYDFLYDVNVYVGI